MPYSRTALRMSTADGSTNSMIDVSTSSACAAPRARRLLPLDARAGEAVVACRCIRAGSRRRRALPRRPSVETSSSRRCSARRTGAARISPALRTMSTVMSRAVFDESRSGPGVLEERGIEMVGQRRRDDDVSRGLDPLREVARQPLAGVSSFRCGPCCTVADAERDDDDRGGRQRLSRLPARSALASVTAAARPGHLRHRGSPTTAAAPNPPVACRISASWTSDVRRRSRRTVH